jgi:hypothetical protein
MGLKLRYRIDTNGYYIPQYQGQDELWIDFIKSNISGEMYSLCESLGEEAKFSGNIWHFRAKKIEDERNMAVFFTSELKVCAFLGAAKTFFRHRIKEFNQDKFEKETK